jgi:O-antigen/teichoic acid export membrane protein
LKKSFWLSFPISIIAIAFSLFLRSLLAKDFDKIELGLYYAALDAVYFAVLPFLGFRATMTIYYAKGEAYALNILRQRYAMLLMFVPAFFASIYLAKLLGATVKDYIMLLLLGSIMVSVYFNNQLGMIRAYGAINAITFIEPLAPLAIYLLFLPNSSNSLLMLSAVAFFVPAIYAAYYMEKKNFKEPAFEPINFQESKHFYKDSLFASLEFGFGMATLFAASFIAAHNANALSDFQVVIKPILMFSLTLFVFPILRFLAPEIAKAIGAKDMESYKELKKFTIRYTLGAFFILAIILIWREEVVEIVFSKNYINAANCLIFIAFATVFAILNTFSLATLKALDGFAISFFIRVFGFCLFLMGYFFIKDNFELSFWLMCTHFGMWMVSGLSVKLRLHMSKLV